MRTVAAISTQQIQLVVPVVHKVHASAARCDGQPEQVAAGAARRADIHGLDRDLREAIGAADPPLALLSRLFTPL